MWRFNWPAHATGMTVYYIGCHQTVTHMVWCEGRPFPGGICIEEPGPAAETASLWKARDTVWTDGSRLDSGDVGAACVWKGGSEEGWRGRRSHLGNNKEVVDAEVYATYQARTVVEGRSGPGRRWSFFP